MFALTIADDLTGAAETAAAIGRVRGAPVRVVLHRVRAPEGEVIVVPLRRSKAERARRVAGRLTLPGRGAIFVKIDSTLRGPWVELVAALAARMQTQPLIAPAFPERGRSVEGGIALVDGAPLFASPFRGEIAGADRARTLTELIALRAPALDAQLVDARDAADLDAVARCACEQGRRLVVGSAGLAEAFARTAGLDRPRDAAEPGAPTASGPVIIAAGSRAAATVRQVDRVKERAAVLRGKGLRLLAQRAVEAAAHGTIVACGGETALQILYALRARGIVVYGEIAPAVIHARPIGADLTLLTKSGSLGKDDAILQALEALRV
ncbi:MAG: hypothetical protein KGM44_07090 [bacterium]|nr:hypothetical protein [bacterium]